MLKFLSKPCTFWLYRLITADHAPLPQRKMTNGYSNAVVMNKCFLLYHEKKLAQIRLVVFEKNAKNAHFNSEKGRHRADG